MPDKENDKYQSILESLSDEEKELLLKKVSDMDKTDEAPIKASKPDENLSQEEIDFIFEKLSCELQEELNKEEEDEEYTKGISLSDLLGESYDTGLRKQKDVDRLLKTLKIILKNKKQ